MGEASRKRARLEAQRKELESAVEKVSHALIRLATAASAGIGSDCYQSRRKTSGFSPWI